LSYHILKQEFPNEESVGDVPVSEADDSEPPVLSHAAYDPEQIRKTWLYRLFKPLMQPLLKTRLRAVAFLALIALLTLAAVGLGALRLVPLKMLPFDNKNEFLLVLDMDEGTSLERTSAVLRQLEQSVAATPEVVDFTTYAGCPSPIDFNGMVRHYYLRQGAHYGEMRINLVGKKNRKHQSHAITLRMRDQLTAIATAAGGTLRLVELPPGPPVLASIVAEVTGRSDFRYEDLLDAADIVAERLQKEPGVVEVDGLREATVERLVFVPDQEKAALNGVSVEDIGTAIRTALAGETSGLLRVDNERQPLEIVVRLPKALRSDPLALQQIAVKGESGELVRLVELGQWRSGRTGQTI
jgi:multidrug efflux pump subunit AcrB